MTFIDKLVYEVSWVNRVAESTQKAMVIGLTEQYRAMGIDGDQTRPRIPASDSLNQAAGTGAGPTRRDQRVEVADTCGDLVADRDVGFTHGGVVILLRPEASFTVCSKFLHVPDAGRLWTSFCERPMDERNVCTEYFESISQLRVERDIVAYNCQRLLSLATGQGQGQSHRTRSRLENACTAIDFTACCSLA
jgi:hypothetical protein